MATGKSTLAKLLAEELACQCIDTDQEISNIMGLSISDIFELNGEDYFRKMESKFLLSAIHYPGDMVLSTGGGMACDQDNRDIMLHNGIVIWIKTPVDILIDRLWNERANRPLVSRFSERSGFEDFVNKHYSERLSCYNWAPYTVQGELSTLEVLSQCKSIIEKH